MTLSRAFGLGESGLILQGIGLGGDSLEFPSGVAPAPPVGVPGDASEYFLDEVSNANPGFSSGTRLDIHWKQDGTRLWSARQGGTIRQYDVDPPWGITGSPSDWTLDFETGAIGNLRSVWFSADGTVFSHCQRVPATSMRITTFDQSATPFDITVLGASTTKAFTPTGGVTPQDHIWSEDGLQLWVQGPIGFTAPINEHTVTVPFDASTIVSAQVKSFDGVGTNTLTFSNDGTQLYMMFGQVLNSYDMTIPFDIDTLTNLTAGPSVLASQVTIPRGLNFRNDNADIFVSGDQNQRRVAFFAKSSGFNLDDFSFFAEKNVSGQDVDLDSFESIWVGPDGENLYTVRGSISVEDVFWFEMSPGHDISSLLFTEKNNADGQSPRAIALQEDGSTLFVYFRNPTNPDAVFRWPLSTNWDVDTKGSRTTLAADFSNAPRGLWFKPDGTELFLMDDADTTVYQFNLPTPWDFTGATQTNTFNYSGQSGSSSDLTLSSDGTKMYLCNVADGEIIQYNLTIPFDVSSAQFSGQFLSLPGGSGVTPRGVAIRDNFLYVAYQGNEFIEQFKVV